MVFKLARTARCTYVVIAAHAAATIAMSTAYSNVDCAFRLNLIMALSPERRPHMLLHTLGEHEGTERTGLIELPRPKGRR